MSYHIPAVVKLFIYEVWKLSFITWLKKGFLHIKNIYLRCFISMELNFISNYNMVIL